MERVSRPVNVFCWLGWYEAITDKSRNGIRRSGGIRASCGRRFFPSSLSVSSAARKPTDPRPTATRMRARSASSCSKKGPAIADLFGQKPVQRRGTSRGGRDETVGQLHAVARADRRLTARKPSPVERTIEPVATPVAREHASRLLPPCAAGASPTSTSRAAGSPKAGTGLPQYVSAANLFTFSRAACSLHATRRGHRRHAMTSAVIPFTVLLTTPLLPSSSGIQHQRISIADPVDDMRQHRPPGRPVVRDIVTPQLKVMRNTFALRICASSAVCSGDS